MSALTLTDAPLGADADALPHAARHAAPTGAVTGAPRVPRSPLPASSSAVSMWDFDEADTADAGAEGVPKNAELRAGRFVVRQARASARIRLKLAPIP